MRIWEHVLYLVTIRTHVAVSCPQCLDLLARYLFSHHWIYFRLGIYMILFSYLPSPTPFPFSYAHIHLQPFSGRFTSVCPQRENLGKLPAVCWKSPPFGSDCSTTWLLPSESPIPDRLSTIQGVWYHSLIVFGIKHVLIAMKCFCVIAPGKPAKLRLRPLPRSFTKRQHHIGSTMSKAKPLALNPEAGSPARDSQPIFGLPPFETTQSFQHNSPSAYGIGVRFLPRSRRRILISAKWSTRFTPIPVMDPKSKLETTREAFEWVRKVGIGD